jgi:hypothetical protein
MSFLVKVLVILFVTAVVAGCKIAVIVVEGGEVQSVGLDTCAEGTICIVEVNDTNFSETFTAVPNPGQHFIKWNSGEGFFCGDSTNPTCVLSTVGTDGNEGMEAIIATDQTFYLMPIFGSEPDTVTVAGKEWAQVDQFSNLSWNDINAVCPAGVCSGILNGYNMTGWTWASVGEFEELISAYEEIGEGGVERMCEQFIKGGYITDLPFDGIRLAPLRDSPGTTFRTAVLLEFYELGRYYCVAEVWEATNPQTAKENKENAAWFWRMK